MGVGSCRLGLLLVWRDPSSAFGFGGRGPAPVFLRSLVIDPAETPATTEAAEESAHYLVVASRCAFCKLRSDALALRSHALALRVWGAFNVVGAMWSTSAVPSDSVSARSQFTF